ncbi:MAG TPA: hypothetical protein VH138_13865, partial [Vicinamibacterales bacterium]|nr:hypothetical protein [Vicinamibacterales bacterium]
FDAGPFAHNYDIYLGTSTTPGLIAVDVNLGPTAPGDSPRTYQLPALAPGTTYYWRVVAKTMAEQRTAGPVWSFTTAGAPGPAPKPLPAPAPGPGPVNACGADNSTGPTPSPTPAPSPGPSPAPSPGPSPAPSPGPATPSPAMWIDVPSDGAAVRQPFVVAGWALDRAATVDNGVDVMHVWAIPASGGSAIFVGWTPVTGARPDVGAVFGALHNTSGFGLVVRALPPGVYTLVVYAHSTLVPGFPLAQTRRVTIAPSTQLVLDTPRESTTVGQGFMIGGWAADFAAASGGGIDLVQVYAYPASGVPIFLGTAQVNVSRPDVGAFFGAQFARTGFNLTAPALPPGAYRVVAYGRSLVAGTFNVATVVDVTVR